MTHPFEVREEIEIDATPEQVWDAIATGPGIDSWFLGRSEIEAREGARASWTLFGETSYSTVTNCEPAKHFRYETDKSPDDGSFMAFEYLLEGRDGGSTVLRFVHSGFLAGDGWETEYDALKVGDRMYLMKLAQVLEHFSGQTSSHNMFAVQPEVTDAHQAFAAFHQAAGVAAPVKPGDTARVVIDGLQAEDGIVAFVTEPGFMGVRTDTSLYMFVFGMGAVVVERHIFSDAVDGAASEQAWQAWLANTFA